LVAHFIASYAEPPKPRHDILATSVHLSRPYHPARRGYR
jgi:hypothetical protein